MDALEFLHSVWEPQGEGYAFLSFKGSLGSWQDLAYKYPADEIEIPDARVGDVYFCPNLFLKSRRRLEWMLPSCWLYADLDEVTPDQVEALLGPEYRPSPCWESSPGRYQGLWHIDRHVDQPIHAVLNQKLSYKIGADKGGWDSTQVLRVPGTLNHKYAGNPEVKLLWQ